MRFLSLYLCPLILCFPILILDTIAKGGLILWVVVVWAIVDQQTQVEIYLRLGSPPFKHLSLSKLMFMYAQSISGSHSLSDPPNLKCKSTSRVEGWRTEISNLAEDSEFHEADASGTGNILNNIYNQCQMRRCGIRTKEQKRPSSRNKFRQIPRKILWNH